MDSLNLIGSAALRSPTSPTSPTGSTWGGLRLTNPAVHDGRAGRRPEATVAAGEAAAGHTKYTPGPRHREGHPSHGFEPKAAPGGARSAIAGYQAVSQSYSYERSDSFDFSVRTAEGDTASISIARAHSESASVAAGSVAGANGQGSVLSLNRANANSLNLEIVVAGDLNDAETASINALLQKVQGVADDFFAGNQAQAATAASRLDVGGQGSPLGAFSFKLQSQETLRAVATYQSVALATTPAADTVPALPQGTLPAQPGAAPDAVDTHAQIHTHTHTHTQPNEGDFLRQLLSMLKSLTPTAQEPRST